MLSLSLFYQPRKGATCIYLLFYVYVFQENHFFLLLKTIMKISINTYQTDLQLHPCTVPPTHHLLLPPFYQTPIFPACPTPCLKHKCAPETSTKAASAAKTHSVSYHCAAAEDCEQCPHQRPGELSWSCPEPAPGVTTAAHATTTKNIISRMNVWQRTMTSSVHKTPALKQKPSIKHAVSQVYVYKQTRSLFILCIMLAMLARYMCTNKLDHLSIFVSC